MKNIWNVLDINPTRNSRDIKHAYAKHLKIIKPDKNPIQFKELREAYEIALSQCLTTDTTVVQSTSQHADNPITAYSVNTDTDTTQPNTESDGTFNSFVTVSKAIKKLNDTLEKCTSQKAADHLEELMSSDTFINLETRQFFESELLEYFSINKNIPIELLVKAKNIFSWDDPYHPYRYHFSRIIELAKQAEYALAVRKTLTELAACNTWQFKSDKVSMRRGKAANLLLTEWNPSYFSKQIKKPWVTASLRELFTYIKNKHGQSYKLALDPRIVAYWEDASRIPTFGIWTSGLIYMCVLIGTYITLDYLGHDYLRDISRSREYKPALTFVSIITTIPIAFSIHLLIHNIFIRYSNSINRSIIKLNQWNSFITNDNRAIFTAILITFTFMAVAFEVPNTWSTELIIIGYLITYYWIRDLITLVPLTIVAGVYNSLVNNLSSIIYLEHNYASIFLFSLFIASSLWLLYQWLSIKFNYKMHYVLFILLSGLMAALISGSTRNIMPSNTTPQIISQDRNEYMQRTYDDELPYLKDNITLKINKRNTSDKLQPNPVHIIDDASSSGSIHDRNEVDYSELYKLVPPRSSTPANPPATFIDRNEQNIFGCNYKRDC